MYFMDQTSGIMATRNSSSSNTLLIVLILVFTFPFWIAAAGICIGILGGVFGAVIGVIGAMFGVLISIIALPFKLIFGWGHWGWHDHWPHFHGNGFITLAIIIVVLLALKSRGRR